MTYTLDLPPSILHGTIRGHQFGCSCVECCDAWATYQAEWRRGEHRRVDVRPVRRHIRRLRKTMTQRAIAEAAGCALSTIEKIQTDEYRMVREETADAILSVTGGRRSFVRFDTEALAAVPVRPKKRTAVERAYFRARAGDRITLDVALRIAEACGVGLAEVIAA